MSKFKVQCGVESFGILGPNGEEGTVVAYGQVSSLLYKGDVYQCVIDGPDPEEKDVVIERVTQSVEVEGIEVEYVQYEGEEEEEDEEEGGDDEGDDDEEEEEVIEEAGPQLVE